MQQTETDYVGSGEHSVIDRCVAAGSDG